VRLEANRPTVHVDGGENWLCHLRGRTRRSHGRIMVGDRVSVVATGPGEGAIDDVAPRGVTLVRPPLSNVHGLIVCFSLRHPVGSLAMLDRRLVLAELLGLKVVVAATKADLIPSQERPRLETWARLYPLVWVSVRTGEGLSEVTGAVQEGIWVLSGESGAGKSSLVGALIPGADVDPGGLSAVARGRQTTRRVSLYGLGAAWIADTPGFSRLDLPNVSPAGIRSAFPEMSETGCRFADCFHRGEPGCHIPRYVADGSVSPVRLAHYRELLLEAESRARGV
jgi:ribosome biogenesis GTPase